MKILNGKLLGQTKSDLDYFQEKIERKCDRLENSFVKEQQQQVAVYKQGLEKVYYSQQLLGKQIKELETDKVNYFKECSLPNSKSNKLIWLNFFMTLTVSTFAFLGITEANQNRCFTSFNSIHFLVSQPKIFT